MQKNQVIPQKINSHNSTQKDKIYDWTTIHIANPERFSGGTYAATVLMEEHYLVMMIAARSTQDQARLCVINLRDTTYQEEVLEKPFLVTKGFSFNKYGENQIIMLGGGIYGEITNRMVLITIESLNPLQIKFQEIKNENAPKLVDHSAEVYEDHLFVFGGRSGKTNAKELWCFDLKEKAWTLCKKIGKYPEGRLEARSWIREDHLYIYGGYWGISKNQADFKTLFALNLKSMQWKRVEQKDPKPGQDSKDIKPWSRVDVNVYGETLLVLKKEPEADGEDEAETEAEAGYKLYCCNRHTLGSWSRIEMRQFGQKRLGNSVVYKNMLIVCFTKGSSENKIELAALPLDKLGLAPSRSAEKEDLNSLFLNQNESDISFKIQDKVIPAHKRILMEKSKFFSGLFNSGMIESTLQVIDIEDCEFDVFQEFLRFLYCGQIAQDFSKISELFLLADKYVQEDLYDKCETTFIHNLSRRTVSKALQFAREHELDHLKNWFFKAIEAYLESTPPFSLENLKPHPKNTSGLADLQRYEEVVDFLIENLPEVVKRTEFEFKLKPYEKVLIEEISTERMVRFTELFYEGTPFGKPASPFLLNKMTNLRDAIFKFVWKNLKSLEKQGLCEKLSPCFNNEFKKYRLKILEQRKAEPRKENADPAQRKAIKRMDPANVGLSNEGPVLKKIK